MNLFTFFAIVAVFIVSYECFRLDENSFDDRIYGGEIAKPGQFPHMVSLRYRLLEMNDTDWIHWCGGSILNNHWILSSASCTQRQYSNTSNVYVVIAVGAHHIRNDGRIYHLDRIRIVNHPAFHEQSGANDVSLLQTNHSIQFTDFVETIHMSAQFVGCRRYSSSQWLSGYGRYTDV